MEDPRTKLQRIKLRRMGGGGVRATCHSFEQQEMVALKEKLLLTESLVSHKMSRVSECTFQMCFSRLTDVRLELRKREIELQNQAKENAKLLANALAAKEAS